ncbi:EAL domain-containing protein [Pseudoxanthomonas dokdonensis]|uniref:Response regulator receiver protein n=1 Tax=Pseudoxanthomonas dokdonensis TaxID=344882 RepID=A0A0R0CYG3_9GAMM|nr:EAL domain-containing protein [Pseudoxanthomonas dokdonensis]KRG71602.1 response regulator receiver protein [Pseudoxanthomonas dokdonensis]
MAATDPTRWPDDAVRGARRAETPPPHYWRRWVADAEPAPEPELAAQGEQAADASAGPASTPQRPSAASAPVLAFSARSPAAHETGSDERSTPEANPYRILIVEDDRSQALFAQSVLRGAGMHADVQMESSGMLEALARFKPDLVLMDLHMPGADGMDLTLQIRQRPEYLHLPIVFLTGDPDPERQFEVLESGADDFLNKPIRPRHLIAAVSNRILRARQREQLGSQPPALNQDTGLHTRAYQLQQLGEALSAGQHGGVFFVEAAGTLSLRERYGYALFEQLMTQVGRQLASVAAPHPVARLNDNSYLVLAAGMAEEQLHAFAERLREQLGQQPMAVAGIDEPLKIRSAIGFAALSHRFADAGSALEATERAVLQARLQADGLAAYHPAQLQDADSPRLSLENGSFELAYQPIVSVAGSEQAQYQVLLRMRQPDGQLLPAAQVIPAAESAGGIAQIDHWVLEHAIYVLAQRQVQSPALRLFVSQSPRTLARDSHAQWLLDSLAEHRIEGTSLVIDLRLSDALIHSVTLRDFCQRLMPAGVQFCLSQFEPGSEADALLSQLPLGFIRVAGRYASAHAQPGSRDQLRHIIDIAHRNGLQVIGPQIEDAQAAAAMWMSGVDFIQGNLVQAVGSDLGFDFHNAVL